MPTTFCRHIKTNGVRCGTPALTGQVFCYFHNNAARRHQSLSPFDDEPAILHPISPYDRDRAQREPMTAQYFGLHPKRGPVELDFPPLEDRESIQLALSMVICALAQNRIDAKRAQPLIYALQVASANAKNLDHKPRHDEVVCDLIPTSAGVEIAPDEDSQSVIKSREFYEAWLAEQAAVEAEDDDDNTESVATRYLRRSIAQSL